MSEEQRSAEDIQAEVFCRIHQLGAVRAGGAHIGVPLPESRSPGTGLNWRMSGFGNALGFKEDICDILADLAKHWNLAA